MQFSFPGGIPSHVSPDDARVDSRRRRAGLLAQPCLRGRVRQSRSDRRLRRRRRRSGNGPAGDRVAFQQVSQPDHRWSRAADPASQWLQDQQPDRPGPHRARGTGAISPRLRLDALLRRGRRARADASTMAATLDKAIEEIRQNPGRMPRARRHHAAALADDRPQFTQGLDGAESRRWPADRGHLPGAPGAAPGRPADASRACQAAGRAG